MNVADQIEKMNVVDQIENLIVRDSENFFDRPKNRSDLHVVIRTAKDFHDFLVKSGENPSAVKITYEMGTIRAGMDQLFLLAHACTIINVDESNWDFNRHIHWNFSELRTEYMHRFKQLLEPDVTAPARLASLFALKHLELVFLAQNFPSSLFGEMRDAEIERQLKDQ